MLPLPNTTKAPKKQQQLNFALINNQPNAALVPYIQSLVEALSEQQHHLQAQEAELNFVLNLVAQENPVCYRRKRPEEFVISFTWLPENLTDIRAACYEGLVKTLSNLFFGFLPGKKGQAPEVYYVTPEVGSVHFPFSPARIIKCMEPVIHAHLVLRNKLRVQLPASDQIADPEIDKLIQYGRKLNEFGLLPAPFPIEKLLSKKLIDDIFKLYRIKGLSYGNLSIRAHMPEISETNFWMTARGVDKAQLKGVGKDILLVDGYDEDLGKMLVSIPPDHDPRVRVSVDAIEHFMIYDQFPEVGAIVHVHAWMEGVLCTTQNYPCGSKELAEEVIRMLQQTGNPGQTAIGLKNHGLTITGPSMEEIFERIEGKLNTKVPMFE